LSLSFFLSFPISFCIWALTYSLDASMHFLTKSQVCRAAASSLLKPRWHLGRQVRSQLLQRRLVASLEIRQLQIQTKMEYRKTYISPAAASPDKETTRTSTAVDAYTSTSIYSLFHLSVAPASSNWLRTRKILKAFIIIFVFCKLKARSV